MSSNHTNVGIRPLSQHQPRRHLRTPFANVRSFMKKSRAEWHLLASADVVAATGPPRQPEECRLIATASASAIALRPYPSMPRIRCSLSPTRRVGCDRTDGILDSNEFWGNYPQLVDDIAAPGQTLYRPYIIAFSPLPLTLNSPYGAVSELCYWCSLSPGRPRWSVRTARTVKNPIVGKC